MFNFNDFANLDDKSIRRILRETEINDLVLPMVCAEKKVCDKIMKNMSLRAVDMLKEDMSVLDLDMSDVRTMQAIERKRQKVCQIAEIVLAHPELDDDELWRKIVAAQIEESEKIGDENVEQIPVNDDEDCLLGL